MGGIHALEHAAIGILPLLVMTDRNDLGGISTPMHAQVGRPAVFIYDGMPGGAGLSRLAFTLADELFARTRDTIADCPCETGCPSCVHSPKCGSGNRPIDKAAALFLLERMAVGTPESDPVDMGSMAAGSMESMAAGSEGGAHGQGRAAVATAAAHATAAATEARAEPAKRIKTASHSRQTLPATESGAQSAHERVTGAAHAAAHAPDNATANGNVMDSVTADGHNGFKGYPPNAEPMEQSPFMEAAMPAFKAPASPRFMVVDVETRRAAADVGGWHRADRMGVSIAVLYDSADDSYTAYPQDEIPAMLQRLREAELVIGFNIVRFDYAVLGPFAPFDLHSLPTLDMLLKIKERLSYRVSLDNLAQATLQAPKSADGLQALRWWKEGRLDLITEYCQKDVELTRELYLFGRANGYLLFTNKAGQAVRVPVSW